jgi:hypothetical protein
VRACLENAFCIAALVNDPAKLIKALADDDKAAKKAMAKLIVKVPERMANLDQKAKRRLRKHVSTVDQEWGKVQQLAVAEIAQSTELREAYLLYRVLSNDACHPSATSLSRHFEPLPDGQWDYKLGPEGADRVIDTINWGLSHPLISFMQRSHRIEWLLRWRWRRRS